MRYIHDTDKFTIEGATVVTLGKFDGVHKGWIMIKEKFFMETQHSGK